MKMWTRSKHLAAAALVATSLAALSAPASAAPLAADHLTLGTASHGMVENVYWRGRGWGGGWGWGAPVAGGLVAGALIGGALAAPYAYGPGPGYYYPQGYYGAPAPAYYGAPPPGDDADTEYCMRRFRSYDPQSGTYLGNDGHRHQCP
jgi:hypothetical protein